MTFLDWNGAILKSQSVNNGASATAPSEPYREGFEFIGWDRPYNNITYDIVVMAMYKISEFKEYKELTFTNYPSFNIPSGNVNTTIATIDVSAGVDGGTEPYIFSKDSGPLWLTVSRYGQITGTRPSTEMAATVAVIRVTDNSTPQLIRNITIQVGAVISTGSFPFTDVPGNVWYYNDVKDSFNTGLIDGKTATTFAPNADLTYAEAVKLAACMHQRYLTGKVSLTNGNPWYQSYVDYARTNGIINKNYEWSAPATRAGYIEIFANALPAAGLDPINSVKDGSIPDVSMKHPQAAAVYKLYRAGIIQGVDSKHNCNPSANIKRSEVSAVLTRMMNESVRIRFSM